MSLFRINPHEWACIHLGWDRDDRERERILRLARGDFDKPAPSALQIALDKARAKEGPAG